MNLAKKWIKDCVTGHKRCREIGSTIAQVHDGTPRPVLEPSMLATKSPKHLLELDQPSPGYVRLLDTGEKILQDTYMTLSHCWGSTEFLKLTADAKDDLEAGVPVEWLSRTFREAIEVTKAFGVKLLWIDSLCTFQDSIRKGNMKLPKWATYTRAHYAILLL
jgi:hypothetical protein